MPNHRSNNALPTTTARKMMDEACTTQIAIARGETDTFGGRGRRGTDVEHDGSSDRMTVLRRHPVAYDRSAARDRARQIQ